MRAWVVERQAPVETNPLRYVQKPVPEPAPGELLVRVLACAVCRTDLHVIEGDLPAHREHVTPGHMVVGTVAALGDGADGYAEGDRVGVAWLRHTDGTCRYCRRGNENLCPELALHRLGRRRRLRRLHDRSGRVRLPAAGRRRRHRAGAVAVRRDHRLPGAAARVAAGGRTARAVRVRRQRPPHRPGRAGPGRHRARAHPGRVVPAARARARRGVGRRRLRRAARAARQRDLVRAGRGSRPGRDAGARPRRRPRGGRDPPDRHPAAELRARAVLREGTAQRHVQHPRRTGGSSWRSPPATTCGPPLTCTRCRRRSRRCRTSRPAPSTGRPFSSTTRRGWPPSPSSHQSLSNSRPAAASVQPGVLNHYS